MADATTPEHRNELLIVGRVTGEPTARTLPSGDEIVTLRVAVDRPETAGRSGQDTLDCTAWSARVRRTAAAWRRGDVVEIEGAVRRRFWQAAGGGAVSRYDIEVRRGRRLAPVGATTRQRTRE